MSVAMCMSTIAISAEPEAAASEEAGRALGTFTGSMSSGGPNASNTAGSDFLKCQAPCSTNRYAQPHPAQQTSPILPDHNAPSLGITFKEHGQAMQICRSFTSVAASQPPSQGDTEHEALSALVSTLSLSNHIAVSLQMVQELHDRIMDMPVEVLKKHCQLMPRLDTISKDAEGGSPLQIAISSATGALAGRLSSASLPAIDRQLGSTSILSKPCRTQSSNEVMDTSAEALETLACVKSATDHASCLSALQGLHRLVSNPEAACAVAQADWLGAFEHLLSACPATREDRLLWLPLFHILQVLTATREVSGNQLVALGCKCGPLMVPMLDSSAQAASTQPDLPFSLTNRAMNSYTRAIFTAAQDALEQTLLTRVVLDFLAQLLCKAHTLSDSTVCRDALVALEATSLLHALVCLYITNDAASYGCRLRALVVLKYLVCCVGDTWRFAWEHPGTQWDAEVAACIGPITSHVCYTWRKRQPASSRGKAMLRQALQCLIEITRSLPASIWAPAWRQEGGTYWLTNLARRDAEWQVRAGALDLLSRLASPAAPATSCMLSQAWRNGPSIAAQMARDAGEAKPVRAAALAYLTATLAARSAYVHQSLVTASSRMPAALDSNSGCPASNAINETTSRCTDSMQHKSRGDAYALASTLDTSCRVPSFSDSHGQNLAWHDDQHIWDWLPSLLKDGLEDPCMARALSGLLLQASLANAKAVHECIRLAACWPDLLHIFSSTRAKLRRARKTSHAPDEPTSNSMSDQPQLWQNTAAMWADSATNLAQLMIVLLQSVPAAALTTSGASLPALLHCYRGAADAIPCSDWDLHSRLMAMQQHVALAVAALCPRVEAAGKGPIEVQGHELQGVAVSAALLLSSDPSHVPLLTKLGTCHLLAALLNSREAAVTFLSDSSGEEVRHPGTGVPVGASLCKSLAGLWSSCPAPLQESATTAPQRSSVAAALCSVLAFSCSAKDAAVTTGLLLSLMGAAEEAGDTLTSRGCSAVTHHQLQQKSTDAAASTRTPLSNLSSLCRARAAHRAQQPAAHICPRHHAGVQQQKARQQLHWALLLLQHLMLDSGMAQAAAASAGCMRLVVKLWNVAVEDLEVLQDLLKLLIHMVADSASAQKAFFCLQGMLERIFALLSGPKPQAATWALLWAVLRNLAALSHGTSALLKHALLLPQVLRIARELAQRKQFSKLPPVLGVLSNIAAHSQGQRALLTTPAASGLLDLLISLMQVIHTQTNATAMLVLHALAHAPEAATHFLAHPLALRCLVTCLSNVDVDKECAAYAASGLWALTYNCQKVKGVLRKIGNFVDALAQAKEAFRKVGEKGNPCLKVRGSFDLAPLHALGHRAVSELIQFVRQS